MKSFAAWLNAILWLACASAIQGCAVGPKLVDHAFGFDALADSPLVEIKYYRYGSTNAAFLSADSDIRQFGKSMQATNINGPIPLGDTLYVKWRMKSNGEEFEETVDLKSVLPTDMSNRRIYFVVQSRQLLVFLIDPVPRPPDWPIVGPRKFQYEKVRQIFPAPNSK